jgi:diguanylate cyclase (GGDEF)-like protein/PAS domain S-box-containing protein
LLQYEPDDLVGRFPEELYHEEDIGQVIQSFENVKQHGSEELVSYRFKRGTGEYIWLETTSIAMKDESNDRMKEIVCVTRDITERKQIEEELRKANDRLSELSSLDGLTGIANRRSFDEILDKEWNRAMRLGQPLAMIMFDIDHFKLYNDTYGHQQGDECIKLVASTARSVLRRPTDFVARYGGEEFAVILPDTDAMGAQRIGEMIRKAIQVLALPHAASLVTPVVTVSVGVAACLPSGDLSQLQLVMSADEALYKAKQEGRNRVKLSK